jgi:hypothetical protein
MTLKAKTLDVLAAVTAPTMIMEAKAMTNCTRAED